MKLIPLGFRIQAGCKIQARMPDQCVESKIKTHVKIGNLLVPTDLKRNLDLS